ncbi:hypothetical protein ACFVIM_05490 [Streptomyces sp. NPDC057638]|uniref:hypothetical protein n=1 Tax=Streptomyces sp. NPDC057638 TaxID=3346190 RepID=UPI003681DEF8
MKRLNKKTGIAVASVSAALLGGLVAAAPAWAAPSGCPEPSVSLTNASNGYMTGKATAACSRSASGTLIVEIKWDKNLLPDPLTAKNSQAGPRQNWSATVGTCDQGNRRSYYARGYWNGGGHHDTTPRHITAC